MKLDLSRKRHFSFEQAANQFQCALEDLIYYVIEGKLSPSVYISGKPLQPYLMVAGEDYDTTGHVIPEELTDLNETEYGGSQVTYARGFYYLVLGNQISASECEFDFLASKATGFDLGDIVFKIERPIAFAEIFDQCVLMATELSRFTDTISTSAKGLGGEKILGTTERNTLLKMVIGMAIKGYSHDPAASKSTAIKEISDDLASLEIALNPDTVRKYLKQATETVLPAKRPKS